MRRMSSEEEYQRRRILMSEAAKKINADRIRSLIQREAYNKNEMTHMLSEAFRRGEFNKSSRNNEAKKNLCIHQCMLEDERNDAGNIDKVNSNNDFEFLKSALIRGLVSSDSTLGAKGGIKRRSQKKRKLRKSRRSIKKIKRKKNKRPTKKRR